MTAAGIRAYRGPALFSFGFRPFFLGGALWSAIVAPLSMAIYLYGDGRLLGQPGRDWHVHEMVFGYLAAVIAGFLLTAIPNWTGRLPVTGRPLIGLFGLWLAGRAAMLFGHALGWWAPAIDVLFLVALAAVIWREVMAGENWRNLPVCALVSLLALANIAFQLRPVSPDAADAGLRLALAAPAMLLALIGGRITPSFTHNWLRQNQAAGEPPAFSGLDRAALATTGVALLLWVAAPDSAPTGGLLILAGGLLLARLARWRGLAARSEPLVWALHAGYAWLGLGLGLIGVSILIPAYVLRTAGVHALTTGAFGVMTLAVMTRATLGHTGRPRAADRATLAIYLAVNAAAVARVGAALSMTLAPALLRVLLPAAAGLWALAFLGFAAAYGPLLALRPSRA